MKKNRDRSAWYIEWTTASHCQGGRLCYWEYLCDLFIFVSVFYMQEQYSDETGLLEKTWCYKIAPSMKGGPSVYVDRNSLLR